jgi:glucosamine--fructose-6-phosphate aminotransferase (isomerizing)
VYVRDGERVVVRRDSYQIYLASEHALCGDPSLTPGGSRLATKPISRLEMSLGVIEKAGYPHFMLKEIMDQPNALRNAMRGRVIKMDWTDWRSSLVVVKQATMRSTNLIRPGFRGR